MTLLRSNRLSLLVAACVAAASISACSSSGGKAPHRTPSTQSTPAGDSSTTSAPSTPASSNNSLQLAAMEVSLLTPAEIGDGFAKSVYQPPDAAQPEPCGQPGIQTKYPNALRTGIEIDKGQQAQFTESVDVFADQTTATAAFSYGIAGLTCTSGTVDGTKVTIGPGQDVASSVSADQAKAFNVVLQGAKGVVVGVQLRNAIIEYAFFALPGADATKLPNPIDLVKAGTVKMSSAIG